MRPVLVPIRSLAIALLAMACAWGAFLSPRALAASKSDRESVGSKDGAKSKDGTKVRWWTDLPSAKAEAVREDRAVLMEFTGSDWCPFCRKFRKEVLDQREFLAYARTNLVLVQIDFPERKRLGPDHDARNEALKTEFAIGIFPTFVLLSADGKELGRQVGYLPGGPKAFLEKLERFRQPPK